VAYVRGNDLWVTDLATGQARQLTRDGSDDIINGTTDWVYEEELGLRDAFRWSPDGRRLAFWRFDQTQVPAFPMVDELGTYPSVSVLRYPKAGAANSRVRVGVLDLATTRTRWLEVGPDTGQYIARMEWMGADSLTVQRLPRRQNRLDLLMVSATTGTGRTVMSERDSAYVDVEDGLPRWINGGRQFLWMSDRSGWRQLYLFDRSGRMVRQVTRDGGDVLSLDGVDEARGQVYVTMAAPDPTQRQLFRFALRGGRGERLTAQRGSHSANVGPGARFAVRYHSSAGQPAAATLHELPSMRVARVLEENAGLRGRAAALRVRAPEFFRVPTPGGMQLDAYRIVPVDFDSTRAYPTLMFAYGGPAAPQVNDAWGGNRYLWHQMLAQEGYVVVVVDNRGAAWRGRQFRKGTQLRLGVQESDDQIAAARWLGGQPWVDAGRIGLWGWSYGGYLTTLALGRGGDVFRAGIAVAPVADWRLYDTIYTERFMWIPQENEEGYDAGSPLRHVAGITARYLLVHGTGDDNVHPQNSIQLAAALQEAGKPFSLMLYPNRTHSIAGAATQAHLFGMMTQFIRDNL
jgi:dipeptidyl-peptidase-4